MVDTIDKGRELEVQEGSHAPDWRKGMSDNVALALVVYTCLTIFVTVNALKAGVSSTLPYFALIILVALIIPACHAFEKRWRELPEEEAHDEELRGAYRRDQAIIWGLAIGLPLLITAVLKALFLTLA